MRSLLFISTERDIFLYIAIVLSTFKGERERHASHAGCISGTLSADLVPYGFTSIVIFELLPILAHCNQSCLQCMLIY